MPYKDPAIHKAYMHIWRKAHKLHLRVYLRLWRKRQRLIINKLKKNTK